MNTYDLAFSIRYWLVFVRHSSSNSVVLREILGLSIPRARDVWTGRKRITDEELIQLAAELSLPLEAFLDRETYLLFNPPPAFPTGWRSDSADPAEWDRQWKANWWVRHAERVADTYGDRAEWNRRREEKGRDARRTWYEVHVPRMEAEASQMAAAVWGSRDGLDALEKVKGLITGFPNKFGWETGHSEAFVEHARYAMMIRILGDELKTMFPGRPAMDAGYLDG